MGHPVSHPRRRSDAIIISSAMRVQRAKVVGHCGGDKSRFSPSWRLTSRSHSWPATLHKAGAAERANYRRLSRKSAASEDISVVAVIASDTCVTFVHQVPSALLGQTTPTLTCSKVTTVVSPSPGTWCIRRCGMECAFARHFGSSGFAKLSARTACNIRLLC